MFNVGGNLRCFNVLLHTHISFYNSLNAVKLNYPHSTIYQRLVSSHGIEKLGYCQAVGGLQFEHLNLIVSTFKLEIKEKL